MVNERQSSVKGNGKYGVIVTWKDNVTDTEWFTEESLRDQYFKTAKAFKTKKSVRRVNR
jgi:hypothetical protein